MEMVIFTFAEYGLPVVGRPLIVTLILCSPTERGTKSALKTPSAVCDTCAGIDCPDGPVCVLREHSRMIGMNFGQTMWKKSKEILFNFFFSFFTNFFFQVNINVWSMFKRLELN